MEQLDQKAFENTQALSSLKGMPVISISTGEEIGSVEDVLVDPGQMTVEALVLILGGLFRQDVYIIPTKKVQTWGKDVILVQSSDAMHKKTSKGELDHARPAAHLIRGMDVISVSGERLGSLGDLLIDQRGRLVAVEITRVGQRLSRLQSRRDRGRPVRLPISTIHSMGKDVLVVNMNKVEGVVEQPAAVEEQPVEPVVAAQPVPVTGDAEEEETPPIPEEETPAPDAEEQV